MRFNRMTSMAEEAQVARAGRSLGLRFAAAAFAACLAFVLAGCGGEEKPEPSDQGDPAAAAHFPVLFSSQSHGFSSISGNFGVDGAKGAAMCCSFEDRR